MCVSSKKNLIESNPITLGFIGGNVTFNPGTITVVGGCPGVGRTTLMESLLANFKTLSSLRSLYVSGIESETTVKNRLSDLLLGARNTFFKRAVQKVEYINKEFDIRNCRFLSSNRNLEDLLSEIRQVVISEPFGFLFLDDFLAGLKSDNKNDQEREVGNFMRHLHNFVVEHQIIAVLSVSVKNQVNRRRNKMPLIPDLHFANAISEYTETIMLLYRPSFYQFVNEWQSKENSILEILVAKCAHLQPFSVLFSPEEGVSCNGFAYNTLVDDMAKQFYEKISGIYNEIK